MGLLNQSSSFLCQSVTCLWEGIHRQIVCSVECCRLLQFCSSFSLLEKKKTVKIDRALVKMMTVMNLLSMVMEHLSCSLHILSFGLTVCGAVSCRDPIPEGFHYKSELLEGKNPFPCKCKSIPLFVITGVMPSGLCKQWRKVMELTIWRSWKFDAIRTNKYRELWFIYTSVLSSC